MALFGSAFWGPGDAQQDAEGFFREQGEWDWGQYKDFLDRAQRFGYQSDEWTPWAVKYFQDVATHGLGSPYDVQAAGNVIMPGRQQVIDSRTGRLIDIGDQWNRTAGGMQDRWGNLGAGIGTNYDIVQGDINGIFGQAGRRSDAAHTGIVGNIGDVYGGARGNVFDVMTGLRNNAYSAYDQQRDWTNNLYGDLVDRSESDYSNLQDRSESEYGGLQGRSTGRYGNLQQRASQRYGGLQDRSTGRYGQMLGRSDADLGGLRGRADQFYGGMLGDVNATAGGLTGGNRGAYGRANRTLQMLNPMGDTMAANAARAWAPQIAATKGRLRAAGIDANSPEAASILANVERQRSRAQEDAYAQAAKDYVDRSTNFTLGEEGVNRDLALNALNQRLNLGRGQEEIGRGLGQNALQNYLGLSGQELENYQRLGLSELADYSQLGLGELGNFQNLGLGALQNYQNLDLGALMNRQGLGERQGEIQRNISTQRLQNDQGLAERQLGMDTNLNLQGGEAFRNELVRNLNLGNELDLQRLAQTIGNRNRAFDQTWNWTQGANALDKDIWGTGSDLARERNQEDLWRYNFDVLQPWQMGNQWLAQQNQVRNAAAGPILNAGNAAASQANAAARTAQGFGQDAATNFGKTIAIESPNAGWGAKLIAAAASAGLGAAGVPINVGGMMPGSYNQQGGANPFGTGQQWRDLFSRGVSDGGLGATGGISPWDTVYGPQGTPWSQPYPSTPMTPPTVGPSPNQYPTQFGQGQGGSSPYAFSYQQPQRRY